MTEEKKIESAWLEHVSNRMAQIQEDQRLADQRKARVFGVMIGIWVLVIVAIVAARFLV